MKVLLKESIRDLELPLLVFPVFAVVLTALGFLFGFRCSAADWWGAVVLTGGLVAVRDRQLRRTARTLALFAGFLGVVWVLANVSFTQCSFDALAYHQPAIRMMTAGWNPIWQATPAGIEQATGVAADQVAVWHVLSMPKGVWYFCAVALTFTHAHFNILFPLIPFLVLAVAFAFLDAFRSQGLLIAAGVFVLSFLSVFPDDAAQKGSIVDYVIALGAMGLLATMVQALRTGEWRWERLIVFTFWMSVSKQTALLHGILFWSVFLLTLLVLKRAGCVKRTMQTGAVAFVLFAIVSLSPYVTSWMNFGHPLYPRYSMDETSHPTQNMTGDFLERNEDAASMGRGLAWFNAFVSPSCVRLVKRIQTGRCDFLPDGGVTWNQHQHSPGAPTTGFYRLCFCLSLVLLCVFCGTAGRFLAVCLIVGTMALPTEMIGYLRYTPWTLSIGVGFAAGLLVERIPDRRGWRQSLSAVVILVLVAFLAKEIRVFAGDIEGGYGILTALEKDPPRQLACLHYPDGKPKVQRSYSGNVRLLQKSVPALAKADVIDEERRLSENAAFCPFYGNNFSVPVQYDLYRFCEEWRNSEPGDGALLGKVCRVLKAYFVTLPRSVGHAIHALRHLSGGEGS